MLTLTYFSTFLIGLIFFVLGMLMYNILTKTKKEDWQSRYTASTQELNSLQKKLKIKEKTLSQTTSEKDNWKNKFTALESEAKISSDKKQELLRNAEKTISSLRNDLEKTNKESDRTKRETENIELNYRKFKDKYDILAREQKGIVKTNHQLLHEKDKLTSSLKKYKLLSKDAQIEIESQIATVNSAKEIQKELRLLRVQNRKLTDDCAYWEKKHYDTHHELAELGKKYEKADIQYSELKEYRNGDQIIMDNLKKQIEQYKTKYIDVNSKYRTLLSHDN